MTTSPETDSQLAQFAALLPFQLDPFQLQACDALERGHGVLVCAPTGAGKTVVGEFAVHLALAAGRKCFYTTPIKALSNQKHSDLVRRYGPERIGLLTGDQSINGDAPVVVMTTEVLRNMLYAGSDALHGLSHVVMDEVHFLADRMRGAVWEEVILHLPEEVRLVSLSATVSNAEEFGGWIQTVRGDTTVVVDEHRPVPLWQHVLVGKRLFDLFDYSEAEQKPGKQHLVDPTLTRHIAHRREADRLTDWQPRHRGRARAGGPGLHRPPARPDVIASLDREGLLPAITFIFSRAGCEAAVKQCLRSPLRLTTDSDRDRIAEVIDRRCGDLADADLAVLDYYEWREGSAAGAGRPSRGHAADLPAHRRGAVHRRPGQGGVRHRDPGAGHQHAGPHRGAGEAGQVQRRAASAADAGGVHPADRSRRPSRHRRRGPRRRAVEPQRQRRRAGRDRRAGLHPDLPAEELVRTVVQHDHQPGEPDGAGPGAPAAGAVVRPVPGRPLGGRSGARRRAGREDARRHRHGAGLEPSRRPGAGTRPDRLRAAAGQDRREGARAVAGVPVAASAGRRQRARRPAPRRHHQHHPGPPRRACRRVGTCRRGR